MRHHVGKHIMKNETALSENSENICGFCGIVCGSNLDLVTTNKNSTQASLAIHSTCPYYYFFQIKRNLVPSNKRPCTNRPTRCLECERIVWSYNIKIHYSINHLTSRFYETCYPSDREIDMLFGRKENNNKTDKTNNKKINNNKDKDINQSNDIARVSLNQQQDNDLSTIQEVSTTKNTAKVKRSLLVMRMKKN